MFIVSNDSLIQIWLKFILNGHIGGVVSDKVHEKQTCSVTDLSQGIGIKSHKWIQGNVNNMRDFRIEECTFSKTNSDQRC